jgi:NADH-quinone oxidoreductase subunit J
MTLTQILFYFFSAIAIFSASMVVMARNPVRAVLFLVLTFFVTGGLWLLLEAEFLAITLVLVYVGAVMVLFLFVVMMLDVELNSLRSGFTRYLPIGLCISVLVAVALVYAVGEKEFGAQLISVPVPHLKGYSHVKMLGELLFTRYLYPFELAGVLLLVAIVAAISLTFRGSRGTKAPLPSEQVKVSKKDRLRLVNIVGGKWPI